MCDSAIHQDTLDISAMSSSTTSCLSSSMAGNCRRQRRGSSNSICSSSSNKSVSFDTVEVRSYPMILDESRDNTGLTIGWESFEESKYSSVAQYEVLCHDVGSPDRQSAPPQPLGYKERIFILMRAGYTPAHLRKVMAKQQQSS